MKATVQRWVNGGFDVLGILLLFATVPLALILPVFVPPGRSALSGRMVRTFDDVGMDAAFHFVWVFPTVRLFIVVIERLRARLPREPLVAACVLRIALQAWTSLALFWWVRVVAERW